MLFLIRFPSYRFLECNTCYDCCVSRSWFFPVNLVIQILLLGIHLEKGVSSVLPSNLHLGAGPTKWKYAGVIKWCCVCHSKKGPNGANGVHFYDKIPYGWYYTYVFYILHSIDFLLNGYVIRKVSNARVFGREVMFWHVLCSISTEWLSISTLIWKVLSFVTQ